MNVLRKVMASSPKKISSRRYKLSDEWNDYKHRDKIQDGVTFSLKYLGSTLVEELREEGTSYGDRISARAVHTIVTMAKVSKKKLKKVGVTISPQGISVVDTEDGSAMADLDIYRICFCTADKEHGRVFAFIARNKDNETMECHAFLCQKRKIAQAVTLTVAASFHLAKEMCDVEEQRTKQTMQPEGSKMNKLLDNLSPVENIDLIGERKVGGHPMTTVSPSMTSSSATSDIYKTENPKVLMGGPFCPPFPEKANPADENLIVL